MKRSLTIITKNVTAKDDERTRISMGYRCSNRHCATQYRRPDPDEELCTPKMKKKAA